MGYRGSFILRPGGGVTVFDANTPPGELEVTYNWSSIAPTHSSFSIRTGDGTLYTFGLKEDVESYDQLGYGNFDARYVAADWRLTQITTQTGRTADFIYSKQPVIRTSYQPALTFDHITVKETNQDPVESWEKEIPTPTSQMLVNMSEDYRLEAIRVGNFCNIAFVWEDDRVTALSVSNSENAIVHRASLTYQTANGGDVTLLKSLSVTGAGRWSFSYYDENSVFPAPGTAGIDWYGYYNGNGLWYSLTYPDNGSGGLWTTRNSLLSGSRSTYSLSATRKGMLKRITWPTGGFTELEYELNTYGQTYGYSENATSSTQTAGLRVSKVSSYRSNDDLAQTVEYSYKSHSGGSSGVLLDQPMIYTLNSAESKTFLPETA